MVKITSTETLSDNFSPLKEVTFDFQNRNGTVKKISREVYLSSNGVAVLLYNNEKNTVILTKQFRMATYLNKNATGMMLEACAGMVEENEDPEEAVIRETEEETGYRIKSVKKIFEMYSTPGSVAELLYYYVAEYTPQQKIDEGGGLDYENEDIEVIEMLFDEAYDKIESGEIKDAKTALLLQYAKINLFTEEKVFDVL